MLSHRKYYYIVSLMVAGGEFRTNEPGAKALDTSSTQPVAHLSIYAEDRIVLWLEPKMSLRSGSPSIFVLSCGNQTIEIYFQKAPILPESLVAMRTILGSVRGTIRDAITYMLPEKVMSDTMYPLLETRTVLY